MKKIGNAINYLKAYFAADTQTLREEASREARAWMISQGKGSPHYTFNYQTEYSAYARAYINSKMRLAAKTAAHR